MRRRQTPHEPRYREYVRVSSPKQLRGVSLDEQSRANAARATALGGTVAHTYTEAGRSAFSERLDKRVAFQEMLTDARAGLFDVLIVFDLSRFSRWAASALQVAADLERLGIAVVSATEYFDRATPAGRMTFTMLAAVAQLKSDALSETMKRIRAHEASLGRHVGPVPLGFRREGGVLIPNEQIAIVQRAFALYATRQHSYATVAGALNDAGYHTQHGGRFSKYQVEEMLKNPVYIGRVRCNGVEYAGGHAPAVEQAVWDAVQAEIARRASRADHDHRAASQPALLSGLARCSNCGAPMWQTSSYGRPYYRCSSQITHARDPRCNLRGVQASAAEAHMLAGLLLLTHDAELLALAAHAACQHAQAAKSVLPDRAALEAKLARLGEAYADGTISQAVYAERRDQVRAQLATEAKPVPTQPAIPEVLAVLSDVPALIQEATTAERRAILCEVIDAAYLTPHQVMAVRPAAAYAELLKAVDERVVQWAGWASGLRNNPLFTPLFEQLTTPHRFRIAA